MWIPKEKDGIKLKIREKNIKKHLSGNKDDVLEQRTNMEVMNL